MQNIVQLSYKCFLLTRKLIMLPSFYLEFKLPLEEGNSKACCMSAMRYSHICLCKDFPGPWCASKHPLSHQYTGDLTTLVQ